MNVQQKLQLITKTNRDLQKLFSQKEWDQNFLEQIKVDFTYVSNKLEGNTLTYGQTLQLIKEFTIPQNVNVVDVVDVVNHKNVLDIVFREYRASEISEERIKQLHGVLMKDISQWIDDGVYSPGQYKSFENFAIRSAGKIHNYLSPQEVPLAMKNLIIDINKQILNINDEQKGSHTLSIATKFHQSFLNEIHPFADGNGRIGRIFMNILLMKQGYPPVFIRDVERQSYLDRFEASEDDAMLDFMADRLLDSLEVKRQFGERH